MTLLLVGLVVMVLGRVTDGTVSARQAAFFIAGFVVILGLGRRAGARNRVVVGPIRALATLASVSLLVISLSGGRLSSMGPLLGSLLVLSFLIFGLWVIVAAPFGRRT